MRGLSALAPLFAQSIGYLLEAILSLYCPARDQIILGVAGVNPLSSFLLSESLPDPLFFCRLVIYRRHDEVSPSLTSQNPPVKLDLSFIVRVDNNPLPSMNEKEGGFRV